MTVHVHGSHVQTSLNMIWRSQTHSFLCSFQDLLVHQDIFLLRYSRRSHTAGLLTYGPVVSEMHLPISANPRSGILFFPLANGGRGKKMPNTYTSVVVYSR